jgi:hypothetical protein
MNLEEIQARNDCAGEGQQQSNRPPEWDGREIWEERRNKIKVQKNCGEGSVLSWDGGRKL